MIGLVFRIVDTLIKLKLMKRLTGFHLNLKDIRDYITASAIMAIIVYILRTQIGNLSAKAIEAAPPILILILVGAAIYTGVLYLISHQFRVFVKEVHYFLTRYSQDILSR